MPKRIIKALKNAKNKANKESIFGFMVDNKKMLVKALSVALVVVVIYSGFCVFQNHQAKKYSAILHESVVAQQKGDIKLAKEKLSQINQAKFVPANVYALASIRYAGYLLDEGDKVKASEIYLQVNDCFYCNDYLVDLAGLLAINTLMSDDELMKKDLSKQINKIYKNANSLKYHIAEQRGFYEIQKENYQLADEIFKEIENDEEVDKSLKTRAQDAQKILLQKGYKAKDPSKSNDKKSDEKKSEDKS
ncbi:hypothetical protein LBMAG18_08730 [Alphaproteobacteria bacterium]|nr:hypothetical protein LBMAG18_08730 [Alphaproteobacteria bacterium]